MNTRRGRGIAMLSDHEVTLVAAVEMVAERNATIAALEAQVADAKRDADEMRQAYAEEVGRCVRAEDRVAELRAGEAGWRDVARQAAEMVAELRAQLAAAERAASLDGLNRYVGCATCELLDLGREGEQYCRKCGGPLTDEGPVPAQRATGTGDGGE